MTRKTSAVAGRSPARKSPLRTAGLTGMPVLAAPGEHPGLRARPGLPGADLRRLMIGEFGEWLRSRTNRQHRPFQQDTVSAYTETARVLDRWMTEQGEEGDFTACDTALLNRFFAAYHAAHGQGGTNTRQRNLRHLFTWLEQVYQHPHPYTDGLHRYSPAKVQPSTLAHGFINDLLEVTGGGRARGFGDARDHAMIRMLTEGVRRTELVQQQTDDLSADLIAQPFVRVVLAATLFTHESAAFGVDVPAGFDDDLLLRCRSGWVVAGVVRPAEEAGERGNGFEQQRVEFGLLADGALRAVAGYEPVPLGLGLVLGGLLARFVACPPPVQRLGAGHGDGPALPGRGPRAPGRPAGVRLVAGELGDGFLGAGIVDEVLAGCGGGDERRGGGVVEGAGQSVGDPVQPGDRIVGEQWLLAAGEFEVVAQVGG